MDTRIKIVSVAESKSEIVETEEGEWTKVAYRRHDADNWEELMGESWEPCYFCEDVEKAYQEYKAKVEVDKNSLRSNKQK